MNHLKTVQPANIVFFDGVCNLCNRSVDFLIRNDKRANLLFAPLQGKTALSLISPEMISNLSSIIYLRKGIIYQRSTAAIMACWDIDWWWKWTCIFLIVPPFIRNAVYDYVAKNRYRWFGQKESCRMPTLAEKIRFLD